MPVVLVTKRSLGYKIIKGLLASDTPFELGNMKDGNARMGNLMQRDHGIHGGILPLSSNKDLLAMIVQ